MSFWAYCDTKWFPLYWKVYALMYTQISTNGIGFHRIKEHNNDLYFQIGYVACWHTQMPVQSY